MTPAPGRFIVLEGADGCGKSTHATRLVEALAARRHPAIHVRDPGSTGLSEAVRRVLLDPAHGDVTVAAETFLYMAARAQLLEDVVRPALAEGRHVVCERWTLSTEVYQGLAGGFGAGNVRRLARLLGSGATPDLMLVLDVAVGAGLARLGRARDRMEQKGDDFHAHVVRGYRRLARDRRGCVLVQPGTLDEVAARVLEQVSAFVG